MINDDIFITSVMMFILSLTGLLLILILFRWWVIDFCRTKIFEYSAVKISILIVLLFIECLSLPWWFLALAYNSNNVKNMELFHKLSVKTSVIPRVKSYMYESSASYYYSIYDGPHSVEYHEKSSMFVSLPKLCSLYTIKGDYDKAVEVCGAVGSLQLIAVNHILNENYQEALKAMDEKINSEKKKNGWDYATRAHIYRELNKNKLFKKDYAKALEMCPNDKGIKSLYKNKNYFKELYEKRKKTYKFE